MKIFNFYIFTLLFFVFYPIVTFASENSLKVGVKHLFHCEKGLFLEKWEIASVDLNENEIKWNIAGSRLNYSGGYYVSSTEGYKAHGLYKKLKLSSSENEIIINYEEKIDLFLKKPILSKTIQGNFTGYSGPNVFPGKYWIKINKKKIIKSIFGEEEVIEIIVKFKPESGDKSTSRTLFSKKRNQIIAFSGNSPFRYNCNLKSITN